MEVLADGVKRDTRKRNIRILAGLFFGILIVLTLFSNMLLSLTLPKVTTEAAISGSLDVTFQDTAILKPAVEVTMSNLTGLTILNVLVKAGDTVHKGQSLVKYDSSAAEQQIDDEQITLKKMKLQLEGLQYSYIEASRSEDPEAQNNARIALESQELDISMQEKRIQTLQSELMAKHELPAPFDGIVKAVDAIEGMQNVDIRLYRSDAGLQFEMQMPVDLAALLRIEEPIEVKVLGKKSRLIQGRIEKIEEVSTADESSKLSGDDLGGVQSAPAPAMNHLLVSMHDKTLLGGERVQVDLSKASSGEAVILSSKAVHKDRNGAYVFTIDNRQGPLGNVYYASKRAVTISAENDLRTAVVDSLNEGEMVILESSEPIQDGMRVMY
jgi:multidrug efflux pump subunit AcrA (membrane-fusion protein)